MFIMMNLPKWSIDLLELMVKNTEENKKPILDRLKELDKKFYEHLVKYVKI